MHFPGTSWDASGKQYFSQDETRSRERKRSYAEKMYIFASRNGMARIAQCVARSIRLILYKSMTYNLEKTYILCCFEK